MSQTVNPHSNSLGNQQGNPHGNQHGNQHAGPSARASSREPARFKMALTWLISPLGLHWIGFGILAVATILLGTRVALDWRTTSSSNLDAMAGREARLRALELQTKPLRGLDKRVELSRSQIDEFYAKRIPPSYSAFLEELGRLQSSSGVRLNGVQYTQAPGSGDLTEIRMDAGISGNYPSILRFINGLERSKSFFVIRAMALSGQQSGAVNLRLHVSTWLRPADAAASGLPVEGAPATPPPAEPAPANGEGE
jgi:hypothetical protein